MNQDGEEPIKKKWAPKIFQVDMSRGTHILRQRPSNQKSLYTSLIEQSFIKPLHKPKTAQEFPLQPVIKLNYQTQKTNKTFAIEQITEKIQQEEKVSLWQQKKSQVLSKIKLAALTNQKTIELPPTDTTALVAYKSPEDEENFLRKELLKNVNNYEFQAHAIKYQTIQTPQLTTLAHFKDSTIFGDHNPLLQNEMDLWHPVKFAALQNPQFELNKTKKIEKTYNKAIKEFKQRLLARIKLEFQEKNFKSGVKCEYLKRLKQFGITITSDDQMLQEDSEDRLPNRTLKQYEFELREKNPKQTIQLRSLRAKLREESIKITAVLQDEDPINQYFSNDETD